MMFVQFFIWGAWYVAMGGLLGDYGMWATDPSRKDALFQFSYGGAAYTVAPIAAILAPLTLGLIADRLLSTEKVLAILFALGAALLWIAPTFLKQDSPIAPPTSFIGQFTHPFILCLLGYMLCFMPTLGLTASLSFSHLANGEKQFPVVRVLGTIGWIVGNWVMWGSRLVTGEAAQINEAQTALKTATEGGVASVIETAKQHLNTVLESIQFGDSSPHIFHAAAIASLVLGIYCLTLPKTTPPAKGQPISIGKIVGVDALGLLKEKSFLVFAIASMLICIPLAGYYAKGYGFVGDMKVTLFGSTTGAMSTGQMSEIVFMLIMPFCFARLGVKWMLAIGMAAWVLRYGLWGFAFGQEGPMLTGPIFLGILLHGICYDFFFVTGMIYTDKKAPKAIRNQAQSLVVMLTQGLGLGLGAQLFVVLGSKCANPDGSLDYRNFWFAPAIFALGVMLMFLAFFWDKVETTPTEGEVAKAAAAEELP